MTEKTVIECDGGWCDDNKIEHGSIKHTDGWVEVEGEYTRHFCPKCSHKMIRWTVFKRSGGTHFTVRHNYPDDDFEEARVGPGMDSDLVEDPGTHSMWIQPLLDEQDQFDDFEYGEDEGWHFHVNDHLGLTVLGQHKEIPKVVLEPDEFPTKFVISESDSGHSFGELYIEEQIDVQFI